MSQRAYLKVRDVLVDVLAVDPLTVLPDADLRDDLGLDSLGALELVNALENEFGESIEDEQIAAVRTVADVVALADGCLAAR
jgi:acyl carrier protein